MKTLVHGIGSLLLVAFFGSVPAAHASKPDLSKYALVSASFGDLVGDRDPKSVSDAAQIFDALQAPINANGYKSVYVSDREGYSPIGLQCAKDHCYLVAFVQAAQAPKGVIAQSLKRISPRGIGAWSEMITFEGTLAAKLYSALPATALKTKLHPNGAGNLVCQSIGLGIVSAYSCTLRASTYSKVRDVGSLFAIWDSAAHHSWDSAEVAEDNARQIEAQGL